MRFISIFTHEPVSRPPTESEMASMGKLIEEGMKAGWLIATEGVHFGATGVRVHKGAGGNVTVTDGPFAETKEVIGGYALLKAANKDEVVELTRLVQFGIAVRFAAVIDQPRGVPADFSIEILFFAQGKDVAVLLLAQPSGLTL